MKILQITPGAGGMYCGACFRDNALVGAFRRLGHSATLLPLYLPLTLDEADESRGAPIFFGGINVYLEDKSAWFRKLPRFLTRWMDASWLLRYSGKYASRTRPEDVGDLTVSMLQGEEGHQARELGPLIEWLRDHEKPDVVNISNVLLMGLVRRLKSELNVPVVATLQGEDTFLDALPEANRASAWAELSARGREVDQYIAPSRYFGELMQRRMGFDADRLNVVPNGITLSGYETTTAPSDPPVLGYFARMCEDKGLDTLVKAYLLLKQRESTRRLRLKIGGGLGPSDEPLVKRLKSEMERQGCLADVSFHPNLDRTEKLAFFRDLTVFSVPSEYGESFGLYVIEALAAGVPVVQPRHAAFPEIIESTGGGTLCEPSDPKALADGIESLLADPSRAREMGERGRTAVFEKHSVDVMAEQVAGVYRRALKSES